MHFDLFRRLVSPSTTLDTKQIFLERMARLRLLYLTIYICLVVGAVSGQEGEENGAVVADPTSLPTTEMIDESWPTQSLEAFLESTTNHVQRQHYIDYMEGCYELFGRELCHKNERDRMALNTMQPALMKNFTAIGDTKVATPVATQEILKQYLEKFQYNLDSEDWGKQTHTNHWEAPTDVHEINFFMPLEDRQTMQKQVQAELEKWCGATLTPVAMYGIRVYRKGAILAPHVDLVPLVISAVINVEQEQDGEDWPLQVIGHDGRISNVTLQPGEMILYESHSVIHGRPYPLAKWCVLFAQHCIVSIYVLGCSRTPHPVPSTQVLCKRISTVRTFGIFLCVAT